MRRFFDLALYNTSFIACMALADHSCFVFYGDEKDDAGWATEHVSDFDDGGALVWIIPRFTRARVHATHLIFTTMGLATPDARPVTGSTLLDISALRHGGLQTGLTTRCGILLLSRPEPFPLCRCGRTVSAQSHVATMALRIRDAGCRSHNTILLSWLCCQNLSFTYRDQLASAYLRHQILGFRLPAYVLTHIPLFISP